MSEIKIPTEAEVAELCAAAGPIARGLAFERDQLRAELERMRPVVKAAVFMTNDKFFMSQYGDSNLADEVAKWKEYKIWTTN